MHFWGQQTHNSSSMALTLDPNNNHPIMVSASDTRAPAPPLPVIDLSGLDGPQHDQVVEAIAKAAKDVGFFLVVNHGLTIEFLEELKDSGRKFFNQPAEKKIVYNQGVSPSPSVTYMTTFTPEGKDFEWVDILSITNYNNEDDDENAMKYWPEPCKEVVLKYIKTSNALAKRIVKFLLKNLGVTLDHSEFETYMGGNWTNMNFYPTCPEPDVTVGITRHSDSNTLTVLLQDEVGGLFVKLENEGDPEREADWVEVTPVPGALLVMVGDCLEILSNGAYKSPEHWVRTRGTESRISIPVFCAPLSAAKVRPLPELAEKNGGPRYKEILFSEYQAGSYAEDAVGKSLINSVKISQLHEIRNE